MQQGVKLSVPRRAQAGGSDVLDAQGKAAAGAFVHDRQVDLAFDQVRSDADGYLSWDAENWSCVDGRRFIRCYSLNGRVLRDSTTHNIYDMDNDFLPEEAKTVTIN